MLLRSFLLLLFSAAFLFAAEVRDDADARKALLQDVSEITAPGVPGGVCVFGPDAFSVIAGLDGRNAMAAVVAAARLGKGRIVAFGHDAYPTAVDHPDTAQLLVNAVQWCAAGAASKPVVALYEQPKLNTHLAAAGWETRPLAGRDWSSQLASAKVLVVNAHAIRERDVEPLRRFVEAGGGLITAATGWGWQSLNPDKNLAADFPANQLVRPAGFIWANNTPGKNGSAGYLALREAAAGSFAFLNASAAIEALIAQIANNRPLDPPALTQAAASVALALRSLPPDDNVVLPRLDKLAAAPGANAFPRPDKPLQQTDALARLMVTRNLQLLRDAPPEKLRAHPAAEFFPGAVAADAPRIKERTVQIDTQKHGWRSTGLYAAPGELIEVEIPAAAAGQQLAVRIGCHKDALWHLEKWERAPEISRVEKLMQPQTRTANAFGGLIYIEVKEGVPPAQFALNVRSAVEAPHFIRGKTGADEWRERIRHLPAPWAELESSRIILSVPSAAIRELEDPEALLALWDQILDAQADLATIPRERVRPERIVADQQISAGYMHAGYPIMTHLDAVAASLSVEKMKSGSWGHFHELGHNHQESAWTFSGTGEVTCNLFSLYVCETICGLPVGAGHDAMEPRRAAERLRKHLATRASFERWKGDPFLALTMYLQLRQEFGWEAYKKVFAEYRALPRGERPRSDDEKRDQWMVRFSHAAGKNLGPFFQAWGVPTSEAARASIAELPQWMPADWPQEFTPPGNAATSPAVR